MSFYAYTKGSRIGNNSDSGAEEVRDLNSQYQYMCMLLYIYTEGRGKENNADTGEEEMQELRKNLAAAETEKTDLFKQLQEARDAKPPPAKRCVCVCVCEYVYDCSYTCTYT